MQAAAYVKVSVSLGEWKQGRGNLQGELWGDEPLVCHCYYVQSVTLVTSHLWKLRDSRREEMNTVSH